MNTPQQTSNAPADTTGYCWRGIGVWGDRSCPELPKYVHCVNCPVFGSAGRGLLERPQPDNYADEWETCLRDDDEVSGNTKPVLIFRLGPEWLALPAASVVFVTENRSIHRLPHRSGRVLSGIVNVQGELHLAFDVRALLEIPNEMPENVSLSRRIYPRIVLCRANGQAFAFPADEVFGVAPLEDDKIETVPSTVSKGLAAFTRGLFTFRERAVGLLDEELLAHSLTRQHL